MGGKKGGKKSKSKSKTAAQKAAAKRHAKFKQTRVQTFGGKKTSFSKAEQARIKAAGYSVAGYSKAAPRSNTQLQVDKDNRMYGNTVPSGSFGISDEGKKIAAAQLQEKRAADKELKRIQAKDPGLAKYFASLPPNIRNDALIGGRTQAPGVELGIGLGTVFGGKALLAPAFKAVTPGLGFKGTQVGFTGMGKTGFDAISKGAKYIASNKPQILGKGAYSSPSMFKVPGTSKLGATRYAGTQGSLFGAQTPGGVIKSIVPGKAPRIGFLESQAKVSPGMFDKGVNLANKLAQGAYGKSPLANTFRTQLATGIAPGGGIGSNLGNVAGKTGVATAIAGGLNIGGGVDSGDAEGSGTGRTVNDRSLFGNFSIFTGNLLKQPKAALAFASDAVTQGFGKRLGDGTLTGNMDFAGNLPGDKGFDNRDVQIKSAVNNAMNSRFVQQYGENLGLPKNFKAQTKDALAALGENYQGATADRDGIYKGTSETLKNLSSDKRLAPVAKFLNQLGTDNENVTDADRNKKFSAMGFQTPFTNEQAADAITAFQPNVAGMPGLSRADRGLIQGSGGNRVISGKLTDIAREAITGNIGTGDSLGIQKGTPLTIGNMLDAGSTIASNMQQDGTLASKRSAEIANLANQAGKITTPSLIKGLIPRFGGSGSFMPNAVSSLGGGATTLAAATPTSVEEVLPLPTTITQTGTNSGNLATIMQNAYQNQMSLYGMNPNYMANFKQPRFNTRPMKRFRQVFNRGYF